MFSRSEYIILLSPQPDNVYNAHVVQCSSMVAQCCHTCCKWYTAAHCVSVYCAVYRNTQHDTEDVVPACEVTLKNLQLDYLDLYLVRCTLHSKGGGTCVCVRVCVCVCVCACHVLGQSVVASGPAAPGLGKGC